jgi:DNA-binding NtrC family response regulator
VRRILVADDEASARQLLTTVLGSDDRDVVAVSDGIDALEALAQARSDAEPFEVLVTDLRMPGVDGLELLADAKKDQPDLVVVLITAHGTVETAVAAMKEGAFDFIIKPFDNSAIREVVDKALKAADLARQEVVGPLPVGRGKSTTQPVGASQAMLTVFDIVDRVAATDSTVLLQGETGTCKELIARRIHELSPRNAGPFVALNCACLPEHLAESELFGHEKGAFTGAVTRRPGRFELADGGTLFLDEVSELSAPAQSKMLRVLQERCFERVGGVKTVTVDVRLLSASSSDLNEAVAAGTFRQDLLFRLNVIPIQLPPLRKRAEDIKPLFELFVNQTAKRIGRPAPEATEEALDALLGFQWPGNIRELQNVAERAVVLAKGDRLEVSDLPLEIQSAGGSTPTLARGPFDLKVAGERAAGQAEKDIIRRALEETGGNVTQAAKLLGISRSTLQAKMKDYNLRD